MRHASTASAWSGSMRHVGYIVEALVDWTAPDLGLPAVIDAFLKPDPDADWSPAAIAAPRQLWEQTPDHLDRRDEPAAESAPGEG
jgi:hypothetical protein